MIRELEADADVLVERVVPGLEGPSQHARGTAEAPILAREYALQRSLPRSGGPQQTEDLPGRHPERHLRDRGVRRAGVDVREVLDLDHVAVV